MYLYNLYTYIVLLIINIKEIKLILLLGVLIDVYDGDGLSIEPRKKLFTTCMYLNLKLLINNICILLK